jgi:diguanylate cyclase (GGDEF)-like protein
MDKKVIFAAFIIFLLFFLTFYFFPNFLFSLESGAFDQFTIITKGIGYFYPGAYSSVHLGDMVIIAIDEATIQRLKKKVPYPRYVYANLLNKIQKGNPKLIVLDFIFTGESEDKDSDKLLAEAIAGRANILFPHVLDKMEGSLNTDASIVKDFASTGYLNKPMDIDSEIRRALPFYLTQGNKIDDYATELHIFSRFYNYDLSSIIVKNNDIFLAGFYPKQKDKFKSSSFSLSKDNTILINYQASTVDFVKIPMWSVLSDDFDASAFKDKVVFVGATAMVFHDTHRTPFGYMSGVEIMANTALMFLDGKFIHEPSGWIKWLSIFLFCMLIVFVCYRLPMLKGFLFTVSVVSIITAAAFWLFINNYYFNPFKLVAVCLVGYIVINFYKYTAVVLENIRLQRLSATDELTRLYTFRFFSIVINHEFQKCLRYKMPLSLLMIDIDNFKKINDTYGHQKGNVVLNKIGKIIISNVRKADFPARYGGEEMAILLPISDIQGAQKCAEHIRQLIEQEDYFTTPLGPLKVTVSIGVSSYPSMNITSQEDMIRLADAALYKAKHEGKNRVVVYRDE